MPRHFQEPFLGDPAHFTAKDPIKTWHGTNHGNMYILVGFHSETADVILERHAYLRQHALGAKSSPPIGRLFSHYGLLPLISTEASHHLTLSDRVFLDCLSKTGKVICSSRE